MPFTAAQIAVGLNYQLDFYVKNDPIDQINIMHPLYSALVGKKKFVPAGNQYHVEQVRITNSTNYQNYFGSDQVTYNEKDTVRQVKYAYSNFHDGFGIDEDRAAANGVLITDDAENVVSEADKIQLTNLMTEFYETLKLGCQDSFDQELHLDGTQNTKCAPGLDFLIQTDPTVSSVVGGFDQSTNTWWRNNASTGISTATAGNLVDKMEAQWRACITYGGEAPDLILVGAAFLDAYRKDARTTINRQIILKAGDNTEMDASIGSGVRTGLYFKGVELVWDPMFDKLDGISTPTIPWSKRCYFINTKHLSLKPLTGSWMVTRKPDRMYDRYVWYRAVTSKYHVTTNKRNCHSVLAIA